MAVVMTDDETGAEFLFSSEEAYDAAMDRVSRTDKHELVALCRARGVELIEPHDDRVLVDDWQMRAAEVLARPADTATALLQAAGETLFGDRWQVPLARAICVNERTMRRWAAGDGAPPPGAMAAIAAELRTRAATAAAVADRVEAAGRT